MEEEIKKAVAAGKLSSEAGSALAALQPGAFCLHKSWGFGKVTALDFLLNQAVIDFKSKRGHSMQLQYAAESLQPIEAGHILARKVTDLEGVRKLASENPVALVRLVLQDLGGRATVDQIADALAPEVFNDAAFKKWWDGAKKALKADGHFAVPTKKNDPVLLRDAPVSRTADLLERLQKSRTLKDQINALDQIIKNLDAFTDGSVLAPVVAKAELSAQQAQRLHTAQAFELLIARDDIRAHIKAEPKGFSIAQIVREELRRLDEVLPDVPAAKLRRVISEFPAAFGDEWVSRALVLTLRGNVRMVSDIARVLQDHGKHEELRKELDRWIRDHSISTEVLYWLCKERDGEFADLVTPHVLSAILTALEREQMQKAKPGGKLHDLLIEDRELIPDLLSDADISTVRDTMRKLLLTPVFEELNKRSLLGRIVRAYPEMESLLTGGHTEKEEALIVSWESLEKRKNEYEDLINKKIPENTKEISIARSYGDLRENFEFKAAKEMQRVLMRRKAEMERDLSRSRGTDFSNVDASQVNIGTIVRVRNLDSGSGATYTILGAWDGVPEQHIVSYLTTLGQALLGRKPGEHIDLPTEHGTEKVEIIDITPYKKN